MQLFQPQKNKAKVKWRFISQILKYTRQMPAGIGEHSDITEAVMGRTRYYLPPTTD